MQQSRRKYKCQLGNDSTEIAVVADRDANNIILRGVTFQANISQLKKLVEAAASVNGKPYTGLKDYLYYWSGNYWWLSLQNDNKNSSRVNVDLGADEDQGIEDGSYPG